MRDLERYLGVKQAHALFGRDDDAKEATAEPQSGKGKFKRCQVCDRLRPVTDFDRDASSPDWLSSVCRSCRRRTEGRVWPSED